MLSMCNFGSITNAFLDKGRSTIDQITVRSMDLKFIIEGNFEPNF